jgi:hypothetical protein
MPARITKKRLQSNIRMSFVESGGNQIGMRCRIGMRYAVAFGIYLLSVICVAQKGQYLTLL